MTTVNDKVEYKACCGCGACYNKCPVGAITMQENEEGFLVPVIDKNKCTNCGLCVKVCPSLNVQYNNTDKPECYAAMADDEIRMKSSSGGIFTLLAEDILDKGGYVCGAAFDDNWDVHHIIVDNKNDLEKLRGSKYVQSDTEDCYKKIKKLLDEDKYVLFSGCPCQVAGLYSFLGKNYEKLYTVDILCHGSPSRGVWKKYLNENFNKNEIKKINFRDKNKIGWSCSHCTISTKNGDDIVTDDFTKLFHASINLRESCYDCKYSKKPRPADITLGDFWGISDHIKGLNDGKGLSFVLTNNEKGKFLFDNNLKKVKKWAINLQENYNNGHQKFGLKMHPKRQKFFRLVKKYKYSQICNIILFNKYDVCLFTTFFALNYGAILVSFAVNKLIEQLGYSVLMLQKPAFVWEKFPIENTIAMDFAQKHYNISRIYKDNNDLISLNNHCKNFVIGSDQVFNPGLNFKIPYLDFVFNSKNKIAFASSFGHDKYNVEPKQIIETKYRLHRFNNIALREKGEKICNLLDLQQAVEVIDPTLILAVEKYKLLTKKCSLKETEKPYLLTYALDINPDKTNAIIYIAKKLKLNIIYIQPCWWKERKNTSLKVYKESYTPEEFLYLYEHASFVVTDSYHGSCFAVKFNKPFISIINTKRGPLRYKLFDKLKMKHRFVESPEEIYNNDELLKPVDFTETNQIVEQESKFAINWLKNALENNNSKEKFSDFENYMDLKIKELSCQISSLPKSLPQAEKSNNEFKEKYLLLGNKYYILKKYYRYKWLAKLLVGKKRQHYIEKAKIFHNKVRQIRKLEKEAELC